MIVIHSPQYPLTVHWVDEEPEILESEEEVAQNLEWFNTEGSDEPIRVTDALGRSVVLYVEKLEVKTCQLR